MNTKIWLKIFFALLEWCPWRKAAPAKPETKEDAK